MRLGVAVVTLVLLAGALGELQPRALAQGEAALVIDRTFFCVFVRRAGARTMEVSVRSGTRQLEDRRRWLYPAAAGLGDRDGPSIAVAAGAPATYEGAPAAPPQRDGVHRFVPRWLAIDPAKCRPAATIRVTQTGLVARPAGGLPGLKHVGSDVYECDAASGVLVRVQARFRTPTRLRLQQRVGRRTLSTANASVVRTASLGVRTPAGRPVAFIEVSESGRARLSTSRLCVRAP